MKKLLLATVSLLFAVSLTFAQDINPEEKVREKVAQLTSRLTLTSEQQESIHAILLEAMQTSIAVKANKDLNTEAKANLLEANKNTKNEKIRALLTDEQIAEFKKAMTDQKGKKSD